MAKVSITESSLRSLTWQLEGTVDSGFLLRGQWPTGNHAMFLALPSDVVVVKDPDWNVPVFISAFASMPTD